MFSSTNNNSASVSLNLIICRNGRFGSVLDLLDPSDFALDAERFAYQALAQLHDAVRVERARSPASSLRLTALQQTLADMMSRDEIDFEGQDWHTIRTLSLGGGASTKLQRAHACVSKIHDMYRHDERYISAHIKLECSVPQCEGHKLTRMQLDSFSNPFERNSLLNQATGNASLTRTYRAPSELSSLWHPTEFHSYGNCVEVGRMWVYEKHTIKYYSKKMMLTVVPTKQTCEQGCSHQICPNVTLDHSQHLQLSGDVESNPGPTSSNTTERWFEHDKRQNAPKQKGEDLEVLYKQNEAREVARLRSQVTHLTQRLHNETKKRKNLTQRSLELEKRKRKRDRKDKSSHKFVAEGLIGDLKDKASEIFGVLQKCLEMCSTVASIKDFFQNSRIDFLGLLVALMNICDNVVNKNAIMLAANLTSLASSLSLTLGDICSLFPHTRETPEAPTLENQLRAQGLAHTLLENTNSVTVVMTFMIGVFSYLCTQVLPGQSEMSKHFTVVGRAAQGWRFTKDVASWVYDYIRDMYFRSVYGISKDEYDLIETFPKISAAFACVSACQKINKTYFNSSQRLCMLVLEVEAELVAALKKSVLVGQRNYAELIKQALHQFNPILEVVRKSDALANRVRAAPYAIYLSGKTGTGKTSLLNMIRAEFAKRCPKLMRGFNLTTCSYFRMTGEEYWSRYDNQPICVLDDIAAKKDLPTVPDPVYEESLHMICEEPMPLIMPDLESKGRIYFDSHMVLMTSNQKVPHIQSLTHPEAFYRRIAKWVDVSIDPKYTSDGSKYCPHAAASVKGLTLQQFDEQFPLLTDHYVLTEYTVEWDYDRKQPIVTDANIYGYTEFMEKTFAQFESRRSRSSNLKKGLYSLAGQKPPSETESEDKVFESVSELWHADALVSLVKDAETAMISSDDSLKDRFEDAVSIDVGEEHVSVDMTQAEIDNEDETDAQPEEIAEARESLDKRKINPGKPITGLLDDPTFNELVGEIENDIVSRSPMTCITEAFNKCKEKLDKLHDTMRRKIFDAASNLVDGVKRSTHFIAKIFFEMITCISGKIDFAVSFVREKIGDPQLLGLCSLLALAFGLWVGNCFPSWGGRSHKLCNYYTSPEDGDIPCFDCPACKAVCYPKDGNMDLAFAKRMVSDYSLADKLVSLGANKTDMQIKTNAIWIRMLNELQEDSVRANAILEEHRHGFIAQHKSYSDQPLVRARASVAQSGSERGMKKRIPRALRTELPIPLVAHSRVHKAGDTVYVEQSEKASITNQVYLTFKTKTGACSSINGLFLVGRTLITNAHIIHSSLIGEVVSVSIRNSNSKSDTIEVPLSHCKISNMVQADGKETDLMLITFPAVVFSRPKIVQNFIYAKDVGRIDEAEHVVVNSLNQRRDTLMLQSVQIPRGNFSFHTRNTDYVRHDDGTCSSGDLCTHVLSVAQSIQYRTSTKKGMCGSLVAIKGTPVNQKFCGLHSAGDAQVGVGALLTQEFLTTNLENHANDHSLSTMDRIDGKIPTLVAHDLVEQIEDPVQAGDLLVLGKVQSPSCPTRSTLSESLIHGQIQAPLTRPAILRPTVVAGEKVDPLLRGITKLSHPQVFINPEILDSAVNDVKQKIGFKEDPTIVHSYAEAIMGVEGDPLKCPINRTTSPGYPYNLKNRLPGKTAWLGSGEEYDLTNEELRRDVDQLIEEASNGRRGDAVSMATLKDEKRPHAKVDAGKTRVFEACPQHLVLAIRMYFLDFAAHVMRYRIENGIAVGVNPYSLEWRRIAESLLDKGNNMVAGDFTNFDGSLCYQVLSKILDMINEWYGDEHSLTRAVLWEHIYSADVVVRDTLIRQSHSQPSGNPLTVIINSLFNAIIMRVAYLMLKKQRGMSLLCDYNDHVAEIIYGDDDIKSIDRETLQWFNQSTITEQLAKVGLTYTDESKSVSARLSKRLDEVNFLKRSFVPDCGFYRAPMALENILDMTNWVKGRDKRSSTSENCAQALRELSLHPKEVYDEWSRRIAKVCRKARVPLRVDTWEAWQSEMSVIRNDADVGTF